jgi:hypothetical protein
MHEIFFTCPCGLMLKVYDDDRAGSDVVCPACNASVPVPSFGKATSTLPEPPEDVPAQGHGKVFVIAYLSAIAIVTAGLVKFLLLPALERPAEVARADPTNAEAEVKPSSSQPSPPSSDEYDRERGAARKEAAEKKAAAKKARERETEERKALKASKKRSAPPDPDPEVKRAEDIGRVDPTTPVAKGATTGSTAPPPDTKESPNPRPNESSPYAHVADEAARKNLEFALETLKKRDPKAISTAELFLRSAEKAAQGDPAVRSEIKKLRDKIANMGVRKR